LIREYRPADGQDFIDLYIASNTTGQDYLSPQFWHDDAQTVVNNYLPQTQTWLYQAKDKIVGAISLLDDEVAGLFVAPSHWRSGVGTALMGYVKQGRSALYLRVFQQNVRAITFYQKQGFTIAKAGPCALTGLAEYEMCWADSNKE